MSNFSAVQVNGGLNLCAQLLGKPGKMDTKGHMVQDLWEAGELTRIDDYCICDALDTYFVFLRTRVLAGQVSLERERELVDAARRWIEITAGNGNLALVEYLNRFQLWRVVGDEDDPFLPSVQREEHTAAPIAADESPPSTSAKQRFNP